MPTIFKDPTTVKARVGSGYPAPFAQACAGREKRALGDAAGLKNYGVNMTRIPPGCASSQRHWHAVQDEFIYMIDGELVLVTDEGETVLKAGMAAGFPAGEKNGHHLVNRSARDAVYLEVGDRLPGDNGEYPDIDMRFERDADDKPRYVHKDGTLY